MTTRALEAPLDLPAPTAEATDPASGTSHLARTAPRTWRPLLLRLHFYAGIFAGPLILLAALSGMLYALTPTIERVVYHDELTAPVAAPLPPGQQVAAATKLLTGMPVTQVWVGGRGETTRVVMKDPTLPKGQFRTTYVDPGTGRPKAQLVTDSAGRPTATAWISKLHKQLQLGDWGRWYAEAAAAWMGVTVLGGLYLWWERAAKARQAGRQVRSLRLEPTATGRARTLSWHGVMGLWLSVGLLFLTVTGLTWSATTGPNIGRMRKALAWQTPSVATTLPTRVPDRPGAAPTPGASGEHADHDHGAAAGGGVDPLAFTAVAEAARRAGLGAPFAVTPSTDPAKAWTVTEPRVAYRFATNSVAVDPRTGQVTDSLRFSQYPLAAKLTWWAIGLHMGITLGLANQLVLVVLGAALVSIVLRGYVMWWRRRAAQETLWAVGRPFRRGGWRQVPKWQFAVFALAGATAARYSPVMGITLVVFLVIDGLVGAVPALRRRMSPRN